MQTNSHKIQKRLCSESLANWQKQLGQFLRTPDKAPDLLYYGTGESAHWAVQSNMNVCAALGILGIERQDSRLVEQSLKLFRYAMRTHVTGDLSATDGCRWGRHWISVLGAERMTHAINALTPFMSSDDLTRYKNFRLCEADFLLHEYPVKASMYGKSGFNRPESNIWNGGFLLRTVKDYPGLPDEAELRDKATSFILNGLSHPLDAADETRYYGKPLREWHVGFNFTPHYSLDHHEYMNVGYSIISLSNLAMLYFNFKEKNQELPPELFLHVQDLWDVVKNFFFDDGRLLRIGGDSRCRYTYCQNYVIPALLFLYDYLGDEAAWQLETNYLQILIDEQTSNRDGSYYGQRLDNIRHSSYYYYCRLESDPPLVLSQALRWHEQLVQKQQSKPTSHPLPPAEWHDAFHNAHLIRNQACIRSYVQCAAQGPVALCIPSNHSDMAEWQGTLLADIGLHRSTHTCRTNWSKTFPDGFLTTSSSDWIEEYPYGEGESAYAVLNSQNAVAALPDGQTLIVLEYAQMRKEATLQYVHDIHLNIPNDRFNNNIRHYAGAKFKQDILGGVSTSGEIIDTETPSLTIDSCLNLQLLYGAESIKILRPGTQNIHNNNPNARSLTSLYADEICGNIRPEKRWLKGEIVVDTGVVLRCGAELPAGNSIEAPQSSALRIAEVRGADGKVYRLAVNFGTAPVLFDGHTLTPGTAYLETR